MSVVQVTVRLPEFIIAAAAEALADEVRRLQATLAPTRASPSG